ncbi:MAG: PhzF family phenazine biosynthesis protein, partial [Candidatus Subteraquimicrobiales bacterium]|nr:PhzF family phenazine biosynthesis protein [Candidatus Subteraquimicrobiales bacterium]
MKQVQIKQVDVFTSFAFTGNPAAVVIEADGLTLNEMQKIAKEMNLSKTVFILKSEAKADFKVRYFTPECELNLAGHPTIAAAYVLFEATKIFVKEPITTITFEANAGIFPVEIYIKQGEVKKIMMTQGVPYFALFEEPLQVLEEALRINSEEIEKAQLPVEIVSAGLPFLLVPLARIEAIEEISPDYSRLSKICENLKVIGVHLFSTEVVSPFAVEHARNFSTKVGVMEEPGTRTAIGALGAYLVKIKVFRGSSPV